MADCKFYSYSFFQNPDWTHKFASRPEILAYIHSCARHYKLESRIRLQQECTALRWSDVDRLWTASFLDLTNNRKYERKARFAITALGVLNIPKDLDDLPALRAFTGTIFHTSNWQAVDFRGKKVMVIGNGYFANQVVPWIINEQNPRSLVHIVKSEQWVAPKGDFEHGTIFRTFLRYVPLAMHIYRLWTALQYDIGFSAFRLTPSGTKARVAAADAVRKYMKSVAAPRYHDILVPQYEFGAKRAILDHGHLQVTNRENFTLVKCDAIRSIEGDGRTVVDSLGNRHSVDIVVMANGFKTQDLLTPMSIYGQEDKELRELWRSTGGAEAYMGVSIAHFPNLFMLTGPNTLPSGNSTLHGIECSIVYITRLLKHLKHSSTEGVATIVPDMHVERRFNDRIQEQLKGLVYTTAVNTWYINEKIGKNTLIWPGSQTAFWWSRCMQAIKWEDWIIG